MYSRRCRRHSLSDSSAAVMSCYTFITYIYIIYAPAYPPPTGKYTHK